MRRAVLSLLLLSACVAGVVAQLAQQKNTYWQDPQPMLGPNTAAACPAPHALNVMLYTQAAGKWLSRQEAELQAAFANSLRLSVSNLNNNGAQYPGLVEAQMYQNNKFAWKTYSDTGAGLTTFGPFTSAQQQTAGDLAADANAWAVSSNPPDWNGLFSAALPSFDGHTTSGVHQNTVNVVIIVNDGEAYDGVTALVGGQPDKKGVQNAWAQARCTTSQWAEAGWHVMWVSSNRSADASWSPQPLPNLASSNTNAGYRFGGARTNSNADNPNINPDNVLANYFPFKSFDELLGPNVLGAISAQLHTYAQAGRVSSPSCTVSGEVHVTTFDGVHYDYNNIGDFWLIKSLKVGTSPKADQLQVQYRTAPCASYGGICITGVAASNHVDRMEVVIADRTGNFQNAYASWNGQRIPFKTWSSDGPNGNAQHNGNNRVWINVTAVANNGWWVRLGFAEGHEISIQKNFINVRPAAHFYGRTAGLCGNWNGCPSDDFLDSCGRIQGLNSSDPWVAQRFGDSWTVLPGHTLFTTHQAQGVNFREISTNQVCEVNTDVWSRHQAFNRWPALPASLRETQTSQQALLGGLPPLTTFPLPALDPGAQLWNNLALVTLKPAPALSSFLVPQQCARLRGALQADCIADLSVNEDGLESTWEILFQACTEYCRTGRMWTTLVSSHDCIAASVCALGSGLPNLHANYITDPVNGTGLLPDVTIGNSGLRSTFFQPTLGLAGRYTFQVTTEDICGVSTKIEAIDINCATETPQVVLSFPGLDVAQAPVSAGAAAADPLVVGFRTVNPNPWTGYPTITVQSSVFPYNVLLGQSWKFISYPTLDLWNQSYPSGPWSTGNQAPRFRFTPNLPGTYVLEYAVWTGCTVSRARVVVYATCSLFPPSATIQPVANSLTPFGQGGNQWPGFVNTPFANNWIVPPPLGSTSNTNNNIAVSWTGPIIGPDAPTSSIGTEARVTKSVDQTAVQDGDLSAGPPATGSLNTNGPAINTAAFTASSYPTGNAKIGAGRFRVKVNDAVDPSFFLEENLVNIQNRKNRWSKVALTASKDSYDLDSPNLQYKWSLNTRRVTDPSGIFTASTQMVLVSTRTLTINKFSTQGSDYTRGALDVCITDTTNAANGDTAGSRRPDISDLFREANANTKPLKDPDQITYYDYSIPVTPNIVVTDTASILVQQQSLPFGAEPALVVSDHQNMQAEALKPYQTFGASAVYPEGWVAPFTRLYNVYKATTQNTYVQRTYNEHNQTWNQQYVLCRVAIQTSTNAWAAKDATISFYEVGDVPQPWAPINYCKDALYDITLTVADECNTSNDTVTLQPTCDGYVEALLNNDQVIRWDPTLHGGIGGFPWTTIDGTQSFDEMYNSPKTNANDPNTALTQNEDRAYANLPARQLLYKWTLERVTTTPYPGSTTVINNAYGSGSVAGNNLVVGPLLYPYTDSTQIGNLCNFGAASDDTTNERDPAQAGNPCTQAQRPTYAVPSSSQPSLMTIGWQQASWLSPFQNIKVDTPGTYQIGLTVSNECVTSTKVISTVVFECGFGYSCDAAFGTNNPTIDTSFDLATWTTWASPFTALSIVHSGFSTTDDSGSFNPVYFQVTPASAATITTSNPTTRLTPPGQPTLATMRARVRVVNFVAATATATIPAPPSAYFPGVGTSTYPNVGPWFGADKKLAFLPDVIGTYTLRVEIQEGCGCPVLYQATDIVVTATCRTPPVTISGTPALSNDLRILVSKTLGVDAQTPPTSNQNDYTAVQYTGKTVQIGVAYKNPFPTYDAAPSVTTHSYSSGRGRSYTVTASGLATGVTVPTYTTTLPSFWYTPTAPGTYTVSLTMSDGCQVFTNTTSFTVIDPITTLCNTRPVAQAAFITGAIDAGTPQNPIPSGGPATGVTVAGSGAAASARQVKFQTYNLPRVWLAANGGFGYLYNTSDTWIEWFITSAPSDSIYYLPPTTTITPRAVGVDEPNLNEAELVYSNFKSGQNANSVTAIWRSVNDSLVVTRTQQIRIPIPTLDGSTGRKDPSNRPWFGAIGANTVGAAGTPITPGSLDQPNNYYGNGGGGWAQNPLNSNNPLTSNSRTTTLGTVWGPNVGPLISGGQWNPAISAPTNTYADANYQYLGGLQPNGLHSAVGVILDRPGAYTFRLKFTNKTTQADCSTFDDITITAFCNTPPAVTPTFSPPNPTINGFNPVRITLNANVVDGDAGDVTSVAWSFDQGFGANATSKFNGIGSQNYTDSSFGTLSQPLAKSNLPIIINPHSKDQAHFVALWPGNYTVFLRYTDGCNFMTTTVFINVGCNSKNNYGTLGSPVTNPPNQGEALSLGALNSNSYTITDAINNQLPLGGAAAGRIDVVKALASEWKLIGFQPAFLSATTLQSSRASRGLPVSSWDLQQNGAGFFVSPSERGANARAASQPGANGNLQGGAAALSGGIL